MLTLAGKIGVGSIAGVALALFIGGPGTLFWMWIIALISAANTFVETYVGILYKEKDEKYANIAKKIIISYLLSYKVWVKRKNKVACLLTPNKNLQG